MENENHYEDMILSCEFCNESIEFEETKNFIYIGIPEFESSNIGICYKCQKLNIVEINYKKYLLIKTILKPNNNG